LLEELQRLNQNLEVPSPEAYGIDHARYMALLPTMAKQAIASGSPANNPVVPDVEEIVNLYRQVYRAEDSPFQIQTAMAQPAARERM